MTPVFADTSFYLALFSQDDVAHDAARRWSRENARPLILTEFILIELGNTLREGAARQLFVELVRSLRDDPATEVMPASQEFVQKGVELFADRPDKTWSLTDCISFAVMRERGLTDAVATDHHFVQAGFRLLLS